MKIAEEDLISTPGISQLGLKPDELHGETVLVTGAGGGIGYEAARALLWLGANVVIAEINDAAGVQAAKNLGDEFNPDRVIYVNTDVGEEASVQNLYQAAVGKFGKVDCVLNNATIAVLGMVKDVPIEKWDASYRVNLRGPVLLAQAFLPGMIERRHGVFTCVSSVGTTFLGGYETFKAAQVHLANTLDAELEGTGVFAFTIGPGLVPTQTANQAVRQLAPLMGMTIEAFYELNKNALLTPEEAGTGFAVAIVFAERFKGMEISSLQALKALDIHYGAVETETESAQMEPDRRIQAALKCKQVRQTLQEQADGWKGRSLFERQWVLRDFKKTAGMSVGEWLASLDRLEASLQGEGEILMIPLAKLAGYYDHLAKLAKGYEKDPVKLQENLKHVYGWRDEVAELEKLVSN
jgi:NAD(P)-dependent dehydrogenase (short-subunit alcohol dehydrogenase family)